MDERRVVLLCPARALAVGFAVASGDLPSGLRPSAHAPARPKPIRAHGVGFTASELLAARNSSNETLRRRFICIATHLFVRQDSRIRVTPRTACSALRAIPSLRSALTAFGGYVLITSRFVCDSCSFHHDSSAKLDLAYQTFRICFTVYAELPLTTKSSVPGAKACSAAAATSASATSDTSPQVPSGCGLTCSNRRGP